MKRSSRTALLPLAIASGVSLLGTALPGSPVHAHGDEPHADSALATAIDAARAESARHAGSFRDAQPRAAVRLPTATNAPGAEAARLGAWAPVDDWPVLPVHAALLPNGKVLAWDATPDDFGEDVHTADRFETRVTVWDPETNGHLRANNDTDTDLFCAGSAQLWDGRVLFAGGDGGLKGKNGPLSNSNLYDPWSNTWSRTDDMEAPRWYSSVAALGTGEMLTFGGAYKPTPIAEVFGFDKRWRGLPIETQYTFSGDYQWLQATSDGDVTYFGPHDTLSRLDPTGTGTWTAGAPRDEEGYRGYGSHALYDVDRVLVAGGGDSLASAVVVDTRNATATPTGPMSHGRRQHNLTVLADGRVLATGGNRTGANTLDPDGAVLEPEVWDPESGLWSTLAPATVDRQYHSIALLLADGRVLTGGGGYCPRCFELGYHEQNVEIFSPPYLFADDGRPAVRPRVTAAPARANYAESFVVATPDAARIRRAHLIRPGSVTHSQNQEQRLVPLEHAAIGGGLLVTAPANRDLAPPGHYLLFLVDENGTPSVGEFVQIGQPLVRADEVVTNRLQANRPDYYAIEGEGSHRLSVHLSGADASVSLFVGAGRVPAGGTADRDGFASCLVADGDATTRRCDVSSLGDTTWYLGVSGAAGTEYAFVAHLGRNGASPAPTTDTSPPGAGSRVGSLAARAVTDRSVTLSWQAPPEMADVEGYEVWRDGVPIDYVADPVHVERTLAPETSYRYHVVAVGADLARGMPSRTVVVTTPAPAETYEDRYSPYIPSPPTKLRHVRYSAGSAELFWEASFDNGFVPTYEVWRDGERLGTAAGLSYYDDALQGDTDHSWFVVAVDDEGNRSAPSASTSMAEPEPADPVPNTPDPVHGEPPDDGPIVGAPDAEDPDVGTPPSDDTADKEIVTVIDTDQPSTDGTTDADVPRPKSASRGGGGIGGTGLALLLALGAVAARRCLPGLRRSGPSGVGRSGSPSASHPGGRAGPHPGPRADAHRGRRAGSHRGAGTVLTASSLALLVAGCTGGNGAPDASSGKEGTVIAGGPSSPFDPVSPGAAPLGPDSPGPGSSGSGSPDTMSSDPGATPPATSDVSTPDSDPSVTTSPDPAVPNTTPSDTSSPDSVAGPPGTPKEPGTTSSDGPLYVGRTWESVAALAQDAVDARGLHEIRGHAERAAASLALHDGASVDVACPGGGSASATSETSAERREHRHAFSTCTLADGSTIDGLYDVVWRDRYREDDSGRRDVEERFALTSRSATKRLEVVGTLHGSVVADRPDECGLREREAVLRIDVPTMRVDDVDVSRLALEDIVTTRVEPAADGLSCGRAISEIAFSNSAHLVDLAGTDSGDGTNDGTDDDAGYAITVGRTGAFLRDGDGRTDVSPNGFRIRIYHPDDDASLDLFALPGVTNGVAVAIDDHPGRVEFDATWDFLAGLSTVLDD